MITLHCIHESLENIQGPKLKKFGSNYRQNIANIIGQWWRIFSKPSALNSNPKSTYVFQSANTAM